jgi:hypothetical protein
VKAFVSLRSDSLGYIEDYLFLINGLLKLTVTELKVLAAFIHYNSEECASRHGRKVVAEMLKMKNVAVLNNYIKALKDKRCIYKNSLGIYKYNEIVSPKENITSIEFTLTTND